MRRTALAAASLAVAGLDPRGRVAPAIAFDAAFAWPVGGRIALAGALVALPASRWG